MTLVTSNAKTGSVTLILAESCRVTIMNTAKPQESIPTPGDRQIQGAMNRQTPTPGESKSASQMDLPDTASQDITSKTTKNDIDPNVPTQPVEDIQHSSPTGGYEEFLQESYNFLNTYWGLRRNAYIAYIAHGIDSENCRAEVGKIGAEFKQNMSVLIAKYAKVEGFNAEFEKKVADVELCRGDTGISLRVVFGIGLVIGLTAGFIIAVSWGIEIQVSLHN